MFISGRKLGGLTSKWSLVIGKEVLKCSGDSRSPNTKFGSNMMSGAAIGGQRKDVFLLGGGNGMHGKLGIEKRIRTAYIAHIQALFEIRLLYQPSIKGLVPLAAIWHQILIVLIPASIIVPMRY